MTAALVLALACPGFAKTYNVSVSQFVEHPSLDAVLKGFQDSLKAQGVEATYSVHNAQANMATANQIAAQIAGESPDLVLAIATPAAQACALATKRSPILAGSPLLFTAITDPDRWPNWPRQASISPSATVSIRPGLSGSRAQARA